MIAAAGSPEVFVLGGGQDDNVGDAVLRREYFDRLRTLGRLHLWTGPASGDFLDALGLHPADAVYPDLRTWHAAAWRALRRGPTWVADKPGELIVDRRSIGRILKLLPLVAGVRLRDGQVLRAGLGVRALPRTTLAILRPCLRLSTHVRWRDTGSAAGVGFGEVSPDWAFGWAGTPTDELAHPRTGIAVTFRGDRPFPSDALVDAVRAVAEGGSRPLVVVTQVRRDGERSARLAAQLGASLVSWPPERTMAEQEAVVRSVYRRSALVISDRLHALIIAMTEGAAPLCLTDDGEAKVARHLDAVGFERSSVRAAALSPAGLRALIDAQIDRRAEAVAAATAARDDLDRFTAHLAALASPAPAGARLP